MTLVVYEDGKLYADNMITIRGNVCKVCESTHVTSERKSMKLKVHKELYFKNKRILAFGCSGSANLKDTIGRLVVGTDIDKHFENVKNTLGDDFKHPSGSALFVLEDMSSVKYSFSHEHEIQYTIYGVNEPASIGSSSNFFLGLACIFKTSTVDRFRLATLTDEMCDPNGFNTIDLVTNKVEACTYEEPCKKFLARIKKTLCFDFPLLSRIKV